MERKSICLLERGAISLSRPLSSRDIRIFSLYIEELQRWAKVFNLVSQWDEATIIRTHILDAIAVSPFLPGHGRLLDLGSGAGLPGLVLAITQPKRRVTLVEVRRKRANFLRHVVREAKLENVEVYERRAENLANEAAFQGIFRDCHIKGDVEYNPLLTNSASLCCRRWPRCRHERAKSPKRDRENSRSNISTRLPPWLHTYLLNPLRQGKAERDTLCQVKFHVIHDGETTSPQH